MLYTRQTVYYAMYTAGRQIIHTRQAMCMDEMCMLTKSLTLLLNIMLPCDDVRYMAIYTACRVHRHCVSVFITTLSNFYAGPSCMICQFWLFAGQCKSIADQQKLLYIFLEAKWRFAWVNSLINSTNQTVSGLFAPGIFALRSKSSQWEPSLPGTKVPRNFCSWERMFSRTFVTRSKCSRELSFLV